MITRLGLVLAISLVAGVTVAAQSTQPPELPEPASLVLFGTTLAAGVWFLRRVRK